MNWISWLILILLGLAILFFLLWRRARIELSNTKFQKQSLSSRYGKMTEQFMPFLKDYPYSPGNFRFLGTPIDGVQFEEDKIIFIEFKAANSRLSPGQQQIKSLVNDGRVGFEEHRIE